MTSMSEREELRREFSFENAIPNGPWYTFDTEKALDEITALRSQLAAAQSRDPGMVRCPECDGMKAHAHCVYTLREDRDALELKAAGLREQLADAEQRARYEADVAAQAIARAESAERERDALKAMAGVAEAGDGLLAVATEMRRLHERAASAEHRAETAELERAEWENAAGVYEAGIVRAERERDEARRERDALGRLAALQDAWETEAMGDITMLLKERNELRHRAERMERDRDVERRARLKLHNALDTLRDHLALSVGDADFAEHSQQQAEEVSAAVTNMLAELAGELRALDATRTGEA